MLCGSGRKREKGSLSFFIFNCFYNYRSLRAQNGNHVVLTRFGASFFASCRASVTVEAALILPAFLYAVCSLMGLGQLLWLEGNIHYAASQTVRWCAEQEAAVYYYTVSERENSSAVQAADRGNSERTPVGEIFLKHFQEDSFCRSYVKGGREGIRNRLVQSKGQEESLTLTTSYTLRIPFPLTEAICFSRRIILQQRIPSGYLEPFNRREKDTRIVYLARNGTVYHTSPKCSYICIRITDQRRIREITRQSIWKPCAHCVPGGRIPDRVYLTAGGSHYHSRMTCSSLKRTIRAVPYREVRGMRKCSRCIEREGK